MSPPSIQEETSAKRWWRRPEFLVSVALALLAIVIGVGIAIPSLLPKIYVSYSKGYNEDDIPAFSVRNDGVLGINDVTVICNYINVIVPGHPPNAMTNNTSFIAKHAPRLPPDREVIALCPFLFPARMKVLDAQLIIRVSYRPDYSFRRETNNVPFDSRGDLLHWTPPKLL